MQVDLRHISNDLYRSVWSYLLRPDNKPMWEYSVASVNLDDIIYFHNKEDATFFKLKFGL